MVLSQYLLSWTQFYNWLGEVLLFIGTYSSQWKDQAETGVVKAERCKEDSKVFVERKYYKICGKEKNWNIKQVYWAWEFSDIFWRGLCQVLV